LLALALYGLASLDAGNKDAASKIAEQLEEMAIGESSAVYWKLETNTPFYGWGTAGRIETTALVLQLLIREAEANGINSAVRKNLIAKGTLFLIKNKDRHGVWYSTQTTINVLDAFLAALGDKRSTENQTLQIVVNGEVIQNLTIPPDKIDPATVDLTGKFNNTSNTVEVRSTGETALMSQIVASHYIDWSNSDVSNISAGKSRALRLDYKCDKPAAAIMQEIACSVEAERIGHQGYGMLLAEIGTPPGADVSRESLEAAMENDWSISRYDVLPDRIIMYMWSKAGGTKFNFKFKPRYGINAQTPASIVYDYYNPEAQATVAPLLFSVK
jgi:A-macroglobulin receptor binding domain/A-macroglobulin TED domain